MNDNITIPGPDPTIYPLTSLPCPRGCAHERGHGFDNQLADGTLVRYHEAVVGRFNYTGRYTPEPTQADVRVVCEEFAETIHGPVTRVGVPYIDCPEILGVDGIVVNELIEALDAARDMWARIVDADTVEAAIVNAEANRGAPS